MKNLVNLKKNELGFNDFIERLKLAAIVTFTVQSYEGEIHQKVKG